MKRTIKLRESELKRMIAESVKRVLREFEGDSHCVCLMEIPSDFNIYDLGISSFYDLSDEQKIKLFKKYGEKLNPNEYDINEFDKNRIIRFGSYAITEYEDMMGGINYVLFKLG